MIDLKVNGVSLELDPATSIRWVKESSLFTEEAVPAPYSFPFQLPASKRNREILSHQDIIRSIGRCNVYNSELYLANSLFFKGNLYVEKTLYRKQYRVKLTVDRTKLVDTLLNEFDYGGVLNVNDGDDRDFPISPKVQNADFHPQADAYWPAIYNERILTNINDIQSNVPEPNGLYCPFLYLKFVLEKVAAQSNMKLCGSFFDDFEIQQLILYNNHYLNYNPASTPVTSDDLDYSNHVPRITPGELLNGLRGMFCLLVDIHKDNLRISAARDILKGQNHIDWSSKASKDYTIEHGSKKEFSLHHTFDSDPCWQEIKDLEGLTLIGSFDYVNLIPTIGQSERNIAYVLADNSFYKFDQNITAWVKYSYDYYPFNDSEGAEKLTAKSSTCIVLNRVFVFTSQNPNYNDTWEKAYSPFGLRLLFRRGEHEFSGGPQQGGRATRPLAGADTLNYDFESTGEYSLHPDDEDGTHAVWWKEFLDIISCEKSVTIPLDLNINDVMNFIPDQIIHIDGVGYLWKRFDFEFTMNGLNFTKAELVKI
jgi:hypothetical protein